jgi:hypothetical protein
MQSSDFPVYRLVNIAAATLDMLNSMRIAGMSIGASPEM